MKDFYFFQNLFICTIFEFSNYMLCISLFFLQKSRNKKLHFHACLTGVLFIQLFFSKIKIVDIFGKIPKNMVAIFDNPWFVNPLNRYDDGGMHSYNFRSMFFSILY